jgi:glucose dehydrogenase
VEARRRADVADPRGRPGARAPLLLDRQRIPDLDGSRRAGDNLFAASIVAVDAKTGKYRWHFQQVRHDIWDYDAPSPVVLFDMQVDGQERKAIAETSKTGWTYVLDRETGKPILPSRTSRCRRIPSRRPLRRSRFRSTSPSSRTT